MKPVNSKSLFTFICDQMGKLAKDEITTEQAKAQANLAKQANNILKYELDRINMQIKISEFKVTNNGFEHNIREIESKPFDNTIL